MNHQESPGTYSDAVTSLGCQATKDGDYLLGVHFDPGASGGTWTPGTGFALELNSNADGSVTEDRIQPSAGPATATFTTSTLAGHPTTALLAFQPLAGASLKLSAAPSSLSIAQGESATATITSDILGPAQNNPVVLTASGVPSGTTVNFSPNPIPAPGSGTSTMSIAVGPDTAMGTYAIVVTGTSGGAKLKASTTLTLTVGASANFSISANPSAVTLVQGGQGGSTITTAVSGRFNSAISLSTTGVPNGTTVSFSRAMVSQP
jgi:hypothetical protein